MKRAFMACTVFVRKYVSMCRQKISQRCLVMTCAPTVDYPRTKMKDQQYLRVSLLFRSPIDFHNR
jgi:hypothetical protein